ncbi:MAG: S-methyl-5-thioribose-1-phosphate isomerase [Treponema sp.]|jgi:methylthioribose-1-phosphate isomerase|nr:S-methyl-5-thioribose-1-phosphate isomerase [Treponema sp.]
MNIAGKHYRTIWSGGDGLVKIINQLVLPHRFEVLELRTAADVLRAIKDMQVRGAGLIGAAAAWGMYLAAREAAEGNFFPDLEEAARTFKAARPTASNLAWAVDRMLRALAEERLKGPGAKPALLERALREAQAVADEDAECCRQIGLHGVKLIEKLAESRAGKPVNVLTHCNAGALAFVDYGSALAPVYAAADRGIPVHVWVDETRPRNQGASLTAWELGQYGVDYDLIVDNAGGHLMQHGMVDLVITGADRVTRRGDAANKIGTYLKALAAGDNGVPFYTAFPSSTFDFTMTDGLAEIPIEERDSGEVLRISGKTASGTVEAVQICPDGASARNWGFDVTPARCITGLITERGICKASEQDISLLYPEM